MNVIINKRRVLGTLFLTSAIVLLVLGETVFKNRLGPVAAIGFWMSCLLATCGAIFCALSDFGHSLRDSRREQRDLLEGTLRDIEEKKRQRDVEAKRQRT